MSSSQLAPLLMILMFFLITTYKMCVNIFQSLLLLTRFCWLTFSPLNFPLQKKESLSAEKQQQKNSQKFIFYNSHETFKFFQSNKLCSKFKYSSIFAVAIWASLFVCVPMSTLWNMYSKFKRLNVKHPLCKRMCIWAVEVF